MTDSKLWDLCVDFHGHACPGLSIGYQAARYAIERLGIETDEDGRALSRAGERLVCISENDACGVDAIQVILSCTLGKGNLRFHLTGKMAFSFYDRDSGQSLRLVLKPMPEGLSREEAFAYMHSHEPSFYFTCQAASLPLPERAPRYASVDCDACGERTGDHWIREFEGRKLCLDCYEKALKAQG